MTAELQKQLDEIKAECLKIIELSRRATPGPWNADALEEMSRMALAQDARESMLAGITIAMQGDEIRANAEFSAICRPFAPAAAPALLKEIEWLEGSAKNRHLDPVFTKRLECIASRWKEAK
jgi:vacuolar-type H+-ATPase subunit E/Vma4